MVFSSLALIVIAGVQSGTPTQDARAVLAENLASKMRKLWSPFRSDINRAKLEQAPKMAKQVEYSVRYDSDVDHITLWKDTGQLRRYDVSRPLLGNKADESAKLDDRTLELLAIRYAIGAGHPEEIQVYKKDNGSVTFRTHWKGIPFSKPTYTVGVSRTGVLHHVWCLGLSKFPAPPSAWDPGRDIGNQNAIGLAGGILAEAGAFETAEVVSSELHYFYNDPARLQKIPPQVELAKQRESKFVLGLVPGVRYNPPTAVSHRVHIRTPVAKGNLGGAESLDWWLYIDAMSGKPINVEVFPELKFAGPEPTPIVKAKSGDFPYQVFRDGRWKDVKASKVEGFKEEFEGRPVVVRQGTAVFVGRRLKGSMAVAIQGNGEWLVVR